MSEARLHRATRTIRQYVIIAQDEANVVVWVRGDSGRLTLGASLKRPDESVTLAPQGTPLALSEIYARLPLADATP